MSFHQNFAPGSRIEVRDEEWLVKNSVRGHTGFTIKCIGTSELVRGMECTFLSNLEDDLKPVRVEDTEFVLDTSPGQRKARLYIESLLRSTPPTDDKLYVSHKAALDPLSFQLEPASKALNALRPRILIADAVGLGKTLEVGMLLSELIARGRGDRILVVTMKSMLAQFQKELWTRFTIPLVRLDSEGLKKVQQKIPSGKNPFHYYKRAIISIDTIKNQRQYPAWLEQCDQWDAVVIDECHNAVNKGTDRNKVVELLSKKSNAFVLLSATPHNGKPESFATLVNMLNPTAIADESDYTHEDVKDLYVRRSKKHVVHDVGDDFPERDPKLVWCDASDAEEALFSLIDNAAFHTLDRRRRLTKKGKLRDVLFKTTLLKSALSSPYALMSTLSERIKTIEKRLADTPKKNHGDKEKLLKQDVGTLAEILKAAQAIDDKTFTKVRLLFDEVLPELQVLAKNNKNRLVIFSERIQTLEGLRELFMQKFKMKEWSSKDTKGSIAVLSAATSDESIRLALESFSAEDGALQIVLASDMASEGINLHHQCSRLIHFDIPWSMIRLEQRNGRIDRYGQTERPKLRYLLTRSNQPDVQADVHIVEKLIEREEHAHKNLGDEGALLHLYEPEDQELVTQVAMSEKKSIEETEKELQQEQESSEDFGLNFWQDDAPVLTAETRTAEQTSLYDDDLSFALDALIDIEEDIEREGTALEIEKHDSRPELHFVVPKDLKKRFLQLPRAARPKEKIWLSADRKAVEQRIKESRRTEGKWPEMQLLWPLHPAMQWLRDRVQIGFAKREAPIFVSPALQDTEHGAIALFQGTMSNKNGQAVIVDWFGVSISIKRGFESAAQVSSEVVAMKNLMAMTELANHDSKRIQDNTLLDVKALNELREKLAQTAREYMSELRTKRSGAMTDDLKKYLKEISKWEQQKRASFEKKKQEADGRARQLKLAINQIERVKKIKESRSAWVRNSLTTEDEPYLKLVALFVAE